MQEMQDTASGHIAHKIFNIAQFPKTRYQKQKTNKNTCNDM